MKPLAITMGDSSGVGPEIVLRTFQKGELPERSLVVGDLSVLRLCASVLTTRLALAGKLSAVVALPINKQATGPERARFSGHTEYVAGLCGTPVYTMMLATERLIVTHVSTHVSLREAIQRVERGRVLQIVRLTDSALRRLRPSRRIAVAGLNPHAGENGAFGDERDPRDPACGRVRTGGGDGGGGAARRRHGVHIVRTSVDHGTAFDMAYQGRAFTRSLRAACEMAQRLARSAENQVRDPE